MHSLTRLFVYIFPLVISTNIEAALINYAIEGDVYVSDNAKRTSTNQVSDTVYMLSGELEIIDQNSTNDFALKMNIQQREYKNDSFTNDTRGILDLKSTWSLVGDGLTWDVDGYYGQQPLNIFTVETPINLQNVGYFTTGPTLLFRLTDLDSIQFKYRYNDYYAELTQADYQSDLYALSVSRRFTPLLTGALTTQFEDIRFKEAANNSYEDFRNFISFTGNTASNNYSLDYGTTTINFDSGVKLKGDLLRLMFSRQLNRFSNFNIQYSDTIDNGARRVNGLRLVNVVTNDVFTNEQILLSYDYVRPEMQILFGFVYSNQDFLIINSQDRIVRSGSLNLAYGLPSSLRYSLRFSRSNADFYGTGQVTKTDTLYARLEKPIGRDLIAGAEVRNFKRESITSTLTSDIEENRFMIFVRYQVTNR